MHYTLLIISNPGKAEEAYRAAYDQYGPDSKDTEFDSAVYERRGGIKTLSEQDRTYRCRIADIDRSDAHPFDDGRQRPIAVGDASAPQGRHDALNAVIAPDLSWHEQSSDADWDDVVEEILDSVDGDCIATLYDCHR